MTIRMEPPDWAAADRRVAAVLLDTATTDPIPRLRRRNVRSIVEKEYVQQNFHPVGVAHMSKVRALCLVSTLFFAGCGSPPGDMIGQVDHPANPPTAEITDPLRRAEMLGRAIFQKDILAARATDIVIAHGPLPGNARVGGWVTVPDGGKWVVYFFDRTRPRPAILQQVNFPDSSGAGGEIGEPGRRPDLEELAAAMFEARQRAVTAPFQACSRSYNSVVLPAALAGEEGWYVYLLAATTEPDVAVLGGHVRVHVSADGSEIMNIKEFTKSCLTMPISDHSVGLMVTHLVDRHPAETHVFMSLLYHMPLYVGISSDTWIVENGSVRRAGQ